MTTRLTVSLDHLERSGLMKLAEQELRDPRDQLRLILRQELERRGLLRETDEEREGEVHNE